VGVTQGIAIKKMVVMSINQSDREKKTNKRHIGKTFCGRTGETGKPAGSRRENGGTGEGAWRRSRSRGSEGKRKRQKGCIETVWQKIIKREHGGKKNHGKVAD